MKVVLIGSSGGGAATLGHTDPAELLSSINNELSKVKGENSDEMNKKQVLDMKSPMEMNPVEIQYGLFLSLHGGEGLDQASLHPDSSVATLFVYEHLEERQEKKSHESSIRMKRPHIIPIITGTLREVNEVYRKLDTEKMTPMIQSGEINGMICISCDPLDVNKSSLEAAGMKGIAVTGSGGTSLSAAVVKYDLNLVGNAGGSVATTTYTRAVSYCYALANAWGSNISYSPFNEPISKDTNENDKPEKPHIRSVLDSCVPAFIAVCVTSHLLCCSYFEKNSVFLSNLCQTALPMVCCVVCTSSYAPHHKTIALMAACIASSVCQGSILAGLVAGKMVSWLVDHILFTCIRLDIPATATNILTAGGSGSITAVVLHYSYAIQILSKLTDLIRYVVQSNPLQDTMIPGYGFLIGCIFCYGSKIGWYHAIFLPIILMEMEQGQASIYGAIDECTLVLVSAGICFGNILFSYFQPASTALSKGDVSISKRGLQINMLYGDFIEAAYPFMERSKVVNYVSYLACGVASEILYQERPEDVLSSAYMPVFMSIWLSKDWKRMAYASFMAFFISLLGSLIGNFVMHVKCAEKEKNEVKED